MSTYTQSIDRVTHSAARAAIAPDGHRSSRYRAMRRSKKAESQSRISQRSVVTPWCLLHSQSVSNRIAGLPHYSEMHPGQILANDTKCEQLRARENDNHAGEKGEAGNKDALKKIPPDYEYQEQQPECRQDESQDAGDLQRQGAEPGQHIESMRRKFSERVVRRTESPRLVSKLGRAKPR